MIRAIAVLGLNVALGGCGAAVVPVMTAVGSVAGTISATEQLGITSIGDYMALKKPAVCQVVVPLSPPPPAATAVDGVPQP